MTDGNWEQLELFPKDTDWGKLEFESSKIPAMEGACGCTNCGCKDEQSS